MPRSVPTGSIALLAVLAAGALAGCGILVDRYDSTRPNYTAEYKSDVEKALVTGQAEEYCAVYGESAELARTEVVDGDPYAVFDCR